MKIWSGEVGRGYRHRLDFTEACVHPVYAVTKCSSSSLSLCFVLFIHGENTAGHSKYKKAQQHKTKIIDEDGLFKMLTDSNPSGKSPSESGAKEEKEGATSAASEGTAKVCRSLVRVRADCFLVFVSSPQLFCPNRRDIYVEEISDFVRQAATNRTHDSSVYQVVL